MAEKGEPMLARFSTSRLTDEVDAEYEGFAERDLSSYDVTYLFVDGVNEAVRIYTNNQPILAAWAGGFPYLLERIAQARLIDKYVGREVNVVVFLRIWISSCPSEKMAIVPIKNIVRRMRTVMEQSVETSF